MPFKKIKSGILEVENFYTNSNVYDFLGNSEYIGHVLNLVKIVLKLNI